MQIINSSVPKQCLTGTPEQEKMIVEIEAEQGFDVCEIDLKSDDAKDKLAIFLQAKGFRSANPAVVIERLKDADMMELEQDIKRCRLEKLGFERDTPLFLPTIGQAHELEFSSLRARIAGQELVKHGFIFARSRERLNGVTELEIVSETLGEELADATTEIVLGPSATKENYKGIMQKVERFKACIEAVPKGQSLPIRTAFAAALNESELTMEKNARGEVFYDASEDDEGPCVHTSRGTPIKSLSAVLEERQSKLTKEAKQLLHFAKAQTDKFVSDCGLKAPHNHKLWEALNLAIYMAAGEGIIHTLMPNNEHAAADANETIKVWTKYAGKNFFGVITRFTAGDLLRSGGLKYSDKEQIRKLFAGSHPEQNELNFERLVCATQNVVRCFVAQLEASSSKDHNEIATFLKNNWETPNYKSVLYWIKRDLKIDFIPMTTPERYPDDSKNDYGHKIIPNTSCGSFAHSQFIPRRERLGQNLISKAPVTGVLEFRSGDFVGNARVDAYFTKGKKRTRNDLDASWNHFEYYVERLQKKHKK